MVPVGERPSNPQTLSVAHPSIPRTRLVAAGGSAALHGLRTLGCTVGNIPTVPKKHRNPATSLGGCNFETVTPLRDLGGWLAHRQSSLNTSHADTQTWISIYSEINHCQSTVAAPNLTYHHVLPLYFIYISSIQYRLYKLLSRGQYIFRKLCPPNAGMSPVHCTAQMASQGIGTARKA